MSIQHISPKEYAYIADGFRSIFKKLGYTETYAQNRLSILAACEDPTTITAFDYADNKWPLPQTNQMWLEWELLKDPSYKGLFTMSTTSYRQEIDPVPGRHDLIFPMVEFELPGGFNRLIEVMKVILEHFGFGKAENFHVVDFEDMCKKYDVTDIGHEEERRLEEDYGPVVFLVNFPERANSFWNMKRNGNTSLKCDVILCGMETFGSAERSSDPAIMDNVFKTQSNGMYAKTLYKLFGKERVLKELNEFFKLDFVPRSGGGIGFTRFHHALKKQGLLFKKDWSKTE